VAASAKTVRKVANAVLNRSKALTPVDTGNLRSSQRLFIRLTKKRVVARVFTRVKYAAPVHEGSSGPYEIVPRRRRALKFKVGGRVVIVTKVIHPGNKARPFLRQATVDVARKRRWLTLVTPGG
jgi:hypothetical protein